MKFDYTLHRAEREVLRSKSRLNELPALLAVFERHVTATEGNAALNSLARLTRDAALAASAAQTAAENAFAALKNVPQKSEAQIDIAMSISSSASAVDAAADVVERAVGYLCAAANPHKVTQ